MKVVLLLLQVMLALIGFLDATYLTWEKVRGVIPSCNSYFECDKVLSSDWAMMGPLPVSSVGMVFYVVFFVLIVLTYLEKDTLTIVGQRIRLSLLRSIWAATGLVVSLGLILIMAFVLQAWCLFCVMSAATSMLLAITTFLLHLVSRQRKGL